MDRLTERLRSEAQKAQQKYLGGFGLGGSHNHGHGHGHGQHSHAGKQEIRFQSLPVGPHSPRDDVEVKIASVSMLGDVLSNTTFVKRDLGFAGQIGEHVFLSYGDTLYADNNLSCETFRGMTSNSVAVASHNPLVVIDNKLNEHNYPDQFVQLRPDWGEDGPYAVGITNVVETSPGSGMLFTLLNHRPEGKDNIVGAGIAKITVSNDSIPVPHAQRLSQYIWDGNTEPWYGDVCALRTESHIYAYGHKKDNPFVYVNRVPVNDVTNVDCYEYWHGKDKGWTKDRLVGDLTEDESVFWQVNQGQVIWSPYYNRFLFIYCDNFWSSKVLIKHASAPEGPWTQPIDAYKATPIQEGGNVYAAVPHPYLDPSGKTLVVTFTNHPNTIQAIKIEFE